MSVVGGLFVLVALAAGVGFIDTGPIGWIDAAQMSLFGRYWRGLSMLVLLFAIGIPALTIWAVLSPRTFAEFSRPQGLGADRPRNSARPRSLIGLSLLVWGALVALVWIAVWSHDAWQQHVRNEDASAFYVPVDIEKLNDAAAEHHHLAVRGRLLDDHAVAQGQDSESRSGTMLVPFVEQRWQEGHAVHFVVRLENGRDPGLRSGLQAPDIALLAKTAGSVPTPARQVFQSLHAPLADDAVVLLPVPAHDGRPLPAAGAPDHRALGFTGTALVTLLVVFFAAGARKMRSASLYDPENSRRVASSPSASGASVATQSTSQDVAGLMAKAAQEAVDSAEIYFSKTLDGTPESIAVLEALADRIAASEREMFVPTWGSYIGEVFRRDIGGEWKVIRDQYGTAFCFESGGVKIFPRDKVAKRLAPSPEDDLVAYYTTFRQLMLEHR